MDERGQTAADATLESVLSALSGLRAEVRDVRAALDGLARSGRPRRNLDAKLLTKRAAARLLGVDRASTLARLIHDGSIRTVQVAGHTRIPASEIDRLAEDGLPDPSGVPQRTRRRGRPPGSSRPPRPGVGDRIRSLDV